MTSLQRSTSRLPRDSIITAAKVVLGGREGDGGGNLLFDPVNENRVEIFKM